MTLTYNSNSIESVQYNGTDLDVLKLNGTTVWERHYTGQSGVVLYGSCQINEDNVLSNFDNRDYGVGNCYAVTPENISSDSTVSEFCIKFKYIQKPFDEHRRRQTLICKATDSSADDKFWYWETYQSSEGAGIQLSQYFFGGNWTIFYNFADQQIYLLKYICNGTTAKAYMSTDDGQTWNELSFNGLRIQDNSADSKLYFGIQNFGNGFNYINSCDHEIYLDDCYMKINGSYVWKGQSSELQKYDSRLISSTPVLLHMDNNVTNSGTAQLNWAGEGFLGSSTGGKFNGYNMYAGWYDFRGLNYDISDSYTIEMWMKTIEYTDNYNDFTWGKGSGPSRIFELQLNNKPNVKELRLIYSNGSDSIFSLDTINEWTHIAITYIGGSSIGAFALFINGIKKTTWQDDGSTNTYNTIFNGNTNLKNLGYSGWDEFVVHNYVRYTKNFALQTEPYTI